MSERDPETGRFLPGNGGRPKGSKNKTMATEKWRELYTFDDLERVYQVLLREALAGDKQAISIYLKYAVQLPDKHLTVDHTSQHLELMRQMVSREQPKELPEYTVVDAGPPAPPKFMEEPAGERG